VADLWQSEQGIARSDSVLRAAFTVRLELPPAALGSNGSHGYWATKARAVKKYREACAWTFLQQRPAFWPWPHAPVTIEVEYRHNRKSRGYKPRDTANAMSAIKALVDGMVDADIVPDDSARWLSWGGFRLFTTADEHQEGVYVRIHRS
jgi:hypothetical protein